MCGCGVVRTCMAVARQLLYPKEGLAPPEAEKLTAPVSLTRPSTVTPGATAAGTWATTSAAPAGTLALGCGAGSTGVPTTRGDGTSLAGASSVAIGGPMTCVGWDEGVGVRAASGWVVGGGVGDQGGRAAQLSLGQCSVTQSEQCVSGESFV